MRKKYEKIVLRLFYALIIFEIVIVLIQNFQYHDKIIFKNEEVITLKSNWNFIESNGSKKLINLPAVLDSGKENCVTISCVLPPEINHMTSIGILTIHQGVAAYLGSHPIYRRLIPPDTRFMNVPSGSIWDIIPLPPDSQGKVLTLQFTSKYKDFTGRINEVHVGTTSSLLLYNVKSYGLSFILSLIIFINAIFLIITYFFIKWLIESHKGLLYLGCFSMLASVWMMTESNLMQLFITNINIISTLSYLSLMTFPLPILLYVCTIEDYHYHKILHGTIFCLLLSDFIFILLQLFNILDFHQTLPVNRVVIVLILGIALVTLLFETIRNKNTEIRIFTISASILFAFGLMEIYFYTVSTEKTQGGFFQIGFFIFILMLTWNMIKKAINIIKLSESAKHYKYLATRDLLTNCRNRVSYAKDLDRIDLSRNITMFMVDLNSMKRINDLNGHQAGDEALILSSQCLLKIFGRRVYRIGGDEFVCITYDLSTEDIQNMLAALEQECRKASEDVPYQISMSAGYATYDRNMDHTIYDTVERADKEMYHSKHKKNTD